MQIEYFQLIDRIVDLNIGEKTITVEAQVPEQSTIFEGHFPGYPIMPGVLLTEAMAQSSGWLLLALTKFERMPFLAMVKEAKMRGFVSPGQLLTIEAKVEHEGSGFAVTSAKVRVGTELKCSADLTFRHIPFPHPDLRVHMDAMAHKIGFPLQAMTHDVSRRKSGSPVSVLPPRSARGWTRIGTRSTRGASMSTRRALRPTSSIPGRR